MLVTKFTEDLGPGVRTVATSEFLETGPYHQYRVSACASGKNSAGLVSAQWVLVSRPPTNGMPPPKRLLDPKPVEARSVFEHRVGCNSEHAHSARVAQRSLDFEPVSGTNLYRIRNVWQSTQYLNIESGVLTAGTCVTDSPIFPPGWWSALWMPEPVN